MTGRFIANNLNTEYVTLMSHKLVESINEMEVLEHKRYAIEHKKLKAMSQATLIRYEIIFRYADKVNSDCCGT